MEKRTLILTYEECERIIDKLSYFPPDDIDAQILMQRITEQLSVWHEQQK